MKSVGKQVVEKATAYLSISPKDRKPEMFAKQGRNDLPSLKSTTIPTAKGRLCIVYTCRSVCCTYKVWVECEAACPSVVG